MTKATPRKPGAGPRPMSLRPKVAHPTPLPPRQVPAPGGPAQAQREPADKPGRAGGPQRIGRPRG